MGSNSYQFYCLNYNNKDKYYNMLNRFKNLNIDCKFYFGVKHTDSRLNIKKITNRNKTHWSSTYGHLDMILDFLYNSNKNYAIICEDDILINSNIKTILKNVMLDFNILNLDILLLGYMLPYKIGEDNIAFNYTLKTEMPQNAEYKYHNFPDYLSGTQMYMINKKHAKFLIDKYQTEYAGITNNYFMPDKILIKDGNRALIYPMLAIENNEQTDNYHILCNKIHYNDNYV